MEVIGRILPPDSSDQSLSAYTSNTNNTSVILRENNTVTTYSLDMVIPINAPQQQVCATRQSVVVLFDENPDLQTCDD